MEPSKVYFINFRTTMTENLLQKMRRLMITAGFKKIDFSDKFTAIKIHFGEPGNLAFLRPNFAKVVADLVKECGGRPFLTDCNTLYVGGRKNGLDHLDAAFTNGFSHFSTGCHIIIADGLKGLDEAYIPVKNGELVKEAKIGHALADADVIISLNHFKGHESTGFGGALKNLGMGGGSRAGKMEMHSEGKPNARPDLCIACGACQRNCAHSAISIIPYTGNKRGKTASVNHSKCVGCGRCIGACPTDAMEPGFDNSNEVLNKKIAEYAAAVVQDKPSFHVSVVMDLSPNCDCHSENDAPFAPDVGIFASFDPVALDQACADAVNEQPILKGSCLDGVENNFQDHFKNIHPETDWHSQVEHGEKIGLGTMMYELVKL